MKNSIKIIFLGIIGFALLVYLTLPKISKNEDDIVPLSFEKFPKYFDVISSDPYSKKEDIFKSGINRYIVVLNHDSLAVFKELYKKTDEDIVLIANISNTPWLIKKIAVNGELENMYKTSKIPLINDSDGNFAKVLNIKDNSQNKYFVFLLDSDDNLTKLFEGSVKKGALQDGILASELEANLDEFLIKLNKLSR